MLVKELAAAHYRELFTTHPERTLVPWPEFSAVIDSADVLGQEFAEQAEQAVPKQADRFDLPAIDRPFAGAHFESATGFSRALVQYIRSDVARRADAYYSQDAAVFDALLAVYGVLAMALTSGKISSTDRVRFVEGQFHGFFSFVASGPPPRRLAELLGAARSRSAALRRARTCRSVLPTAHFWPAHRHFPERFGPGPWSMPGSPGRMSRWPPTR